MVTVDSLQELLIALFNGTIVDPPTIIPRTFRLPQPHDWHNKIHNNLLRLSKTDDFSVI